MQLDFFNTINLSGVPLQEATEKACHQNDRVLKIMKELIKATPFQVSEVYDKLYSPAPITSIRRSMTVLTSQGKLEMTDEMKKGKYGMNNHVWKIIE